MALSEKSKRRIAEDVLSSWLRLTSVVRNERIVTKMTFNEAFICGLLMQKSPLTATDLCAKTNLLKSQMNKILGDMENHGYILRERSTGDKRAVFINLTQKGKEIYHSSHEKTLDILYRLTERIGSDAASAASEIMSRISDEMSDILRGLENED